MRIKDMPAIPMDAPRLQPVEDKRAGGGATHNFQRHMSDANSADYERYIQDLADRIFKQGEMISRKVDLAEYQKYRELIMELFKETASNSYVFCKNEKFNARGRHKIFAVIRKVNQRLDELAAAVLSKEADNITMLDIVDDIRGMLVDLFL